MWIQLLDLRARCTANGRYRWKPSRRPYWDPSFSAMLNVHNYTANLRHAIEAISRRWLAGMAEALQGRSGPVLSAQVAAAPEP